MNKIGRGLLKEIRKIKNRYVHNSGWGFCVEDEFLNALEYVVILKNGSIFFIQPGSYIIPDFKFSDVLYVRKTNYNKYSYDFVDSIRGGFNKDDFNEKDILNMLKKKYKVTHIIRTCFDD